MTRFPNCRFDVVRLPLFLLIAASMVTPTALSSTQRLLSESELAKKTVYRSLDDALEHVDDAYRLVITGQSGIEEIPSTIGRLTRLQELTISGTEITALPPEIGRLSNLQTLELSFNRHLTSLPAEVGALRNLQVLDASLGELEEIPPSIGRLAALRVLDLSTNAVTELPPELGDLARLEELNLSGNPLGTLPSEIGGLSNLRHLNVLSTRLTELPAEIGKLGNLEYLTALQNELTTLPPELGDLASLQDLYLGANAITRLPESMRRLGNLTHLSMPNNRLTRLPSWIGELRGLRGLSLAGNAITEVPPEIGALAKLASLDLGGNALSSIPPEIGNLGQLENLYLGDNGLTAVPATLLRLTHLEFLDLRGNRIESLPEEIVGILDLTNPLGQRNSEINRAYGWTSGPRLFERAAALASASAAPDVRRARTVVALIDSVEAGLKPGTELDPGDLDAAGAALGSYLEDNPDDVEALILFAKLGRIVNLKTPSVFARGEDPPDAEAQYAPLHAALDRALAIEPNNPEALYWKARLFGVRVPDLSSGRVAYRFLDLPRAIRLVERAMEIAPDTVRYREALATFLLSDGRDADARELMRDVMDGQHPMYLLLMDIAEFPIPAEAIFSPEDGASLAQMWGIPDYPTLRVRLHVVPGSAANLEAFFRRRWPEFQFAVQDADGTQAYTQHLTRRNGAYVPADPNAEVPGRPSEGVLVMVFQLDEVTPETAAGHPLPADLSAPYCYLMVVNFR